MKQLYTFFIFLTACIFSAGSVNAQTFDLRFATDLECATAEYCANVQISSQSGSFKIGTSSIFFYYNQDGLSFKEYNSLNFDGSANCIAEVAPAWLEQQAYTLEPGLVNITLTLTNNDYSCPEIMEAAWVDVARICFDITDDNQSCGLSFSEENTNFNSNDPNNGSNPILKGNLEGLDELLACAASDDSVADGTTDTGTTDVIMDDSADFGTTDGMTDGVTDLGTADGMVDDSTMDTSTDSAAGTNGTTDGTTTNCDNITNIVITEINYNSPTVYDSGDWIEFYNPNSTSVDMSGWTMKDASNEFVFPAGTSIAANEYLVLITDEAAFNFAFPMVVSYAGPADLGFSNGGELLTLVNAEGCDVDMVEYDDDIPWPTAADGNGPTITLIDSNADNNAGSNWAASSSTGGTPNGPEVNEVDECEAPNAPSISAGQATICDGEVIVISASPAAPAGFSFKWVMDGTTTLTETGASIQVSTAGVYQASIINDIEADCQSGFSNLVVIAAGTNCGGTTDMGTSDGVTDDAVMDTASTDGMTDDSAGDIGTTDDSTMDTASTEGTTDGGGTMDGVATDISTDDSMVDSMVDGTTDMGTSDGATDDSSTTVCPTLTNANANPGGICSGATVELTYELQNGDGGTLVWYDNNGDVVLDPANAMVYTNNCDGEFVSFTAVYTPLNSNCAEVSIQPNTVFVLPSPGNMITIIDGCTISLENVCSTFEIAWSDSFGNVGAGSTYTADEDQTGMVAFSASVAGGLPGCEPVTVTANFTCDMIANDDSTTDDSTMDTTSTDGTMDGMTDDSTGDIGTTDDSTMDTTSTDGTMDGMTDDSTGDIGTTDDSTMDTTSTDGTMDGMTDDSTGDIGTTDDSTMDTTSTDGTTDGTTIITDCTNAQVCSGEIFCTAPLTPITICPQFDCLLGNMFTLHSVHSTYECGIIVSGSCFIYTPLPGMEQFSPDYAAVTGSDEFGNCASMQIMINIGVCNQAPNATNDIATTNQDTSVTISVLPNDTDPDDDTLEICDFTQANNGTITLVNGQFVYMPDADFYGSDIFTYTICDGNGNSDTAIVTVTVIEIVNLAPNATNDIATTDQDTSVTISVLPNDSDPEGDTLEICDFTQPANGSVTLVNGQFVYAPNAGFYGSEMFTYTICDGNGNSDTATVTVTVNEIVNNAPVANDDIYMIPADVPFSVPVLGNDSDPDGDNLDICDYTQPINGTLALVNGELVYTPFDGFFGNDIFTYVICDGNGNSDTATVFISVEKPIDPCANPASCGPYAYCVSPMVPYEICFDDCLQGGEVISHNSLYGCGVQYLTNGCIRYTPLPGMEEIGVDQVTLLLSDGNSCFEIIIDLEISNCGANTAPDAVNDFVTTDQDTPVTISVLPNDTDPDGDDIYVCGDYSQPLNGVVTQNGNTFVYTPNTGFAGTDDFTYQICDGNGGSDFATVYIEVISTGCDNPEVHYCVEALQPMVICPEFCALTNDTYTLTDMHSVYGCSVSNMGDCIRYVSTPGFTGNDIVQIVACSNTTAVCDTVILSVEVGNCGGINNPPIATIDLVTATINTPNNINVLGNDTDPDGDSFEICGFTQANNGTVNQSGNQLVYTPNTNFTGSDSFTYNICDGNGGFASATVIIVISTGNTEPEPTNTNPQATNDMIATDYETQVIISVLGNDTDADNDNLEVCNISDATSGTVAVNGTQIVYTPAAGFSGMASFSYTVCDGNGGTDSATVTVTVNDEVIAQDCPGLGNFGMACDDGDMNTTNDVIQSDCTCAGTVVSNECTANAGTLTAVESSVCNGVEMSATVNTEPIVPAGYSVAYVLTSGSGLVIQQLATTPSFTTETPGNYTIHTFVYDANIIDVSSVVLGVTTGFDVFSLLIEGGGSVCGALDVMGAGVTVENCTTGGTNTAPTAVDDAASTTAGTAVTITVLANDSDADGDPIAVCDITMPSNGTFQLFDNEIVYTPNVGFMGTDSFTYTICDGNEGQSEATVSITVAAGNSMPIAQDDAVSTDAATAVSISVISNDFDIDGDDLTICGNTEPSNGTVTAFAEGFIYEPASGFVGTDTFTYTVCDGNGGETSATVTITVNEVVNSNGNPIANDDSTTTFQDEQVAINVIENDFEPDGDNLTICGITDASNGTASIAGNQVIYMPNAAYTGTDSFTYTICDGNGGESTATVSVAVVPNDTGFEPTIQDLCTGIQESIDICVEFHTTLAAITEVTTTYDCGITVLNENCFRYTPLPGFENIGDVINVEGCFEDSCVTVPVNIYVGDCETADQNTDPLAVDDNVTIVQNQTIEISVLTNDSDADGDVLEICDYSQPSNGVVDFVGGVFTYIPDATYTGNDNFSYTICDGNGGSAIGLVSIIINTLDSGCDTVHPSYCTTPIDPTAPNPLVVCVDFCNSAAEIIDLVSTYHCAVQIADEQGPNCFVYTPLPLFTGDDYVQVQGCDANGDCEIVMLNITVQEDCGNGKLPEDALKAPECELEIPNVLTPNGDGINDVLKIEAINCWNDLNLTMDIYNTQGALINSMNINNSYEIWNGQNANGTIVGAGTYFYIIKSLDGTVKNHKKGFIEIRK